MLCVIDMAPRPEGLMPDQASSLEALARQVMSQMELRRAITERELLVQEAHHRVKNSLQMVQSLLSLQARMTEYPEAAQQLRESATRISAFGAMHEHLYKVGAGIEINLRSYLGDLVRSQNEALASTIEGRDIAFNAESAVWPAADAPTVGLILMELVTNALKYGKGVVTVTLRSLGEEVVLSVEDEGTMLPSEFCSQPEQRIGDARPDGLSEWQAWPAEHRSIAQPHLLRRRPDTARTQSGPADVVDLKIAGLFTLAKRNSPS